MSHSRIFQIQFLLILLSVVLTEYDRCRFIHKREAFRFNSLDTDKPFVGELKSTSGVLQGKVHFNVCSPIKADKIPAGCPVEKQSSVYFVDTANKCFALTPRKGDKVGKWSHITSEKLTNLIYNNSELPQTEVPYKTSFQLLCDDKDKEGKVADIFSYTLENNLIIIGITSEKACGYDLDELLEFFSDNKWYIGPVFVIFGALLALAGVRLFKVALFIVGFILG